jgi:hypothetical protein
MKAFKWAVVIVCVAALIGSMWVVFFRPVAASPAAFEPIGSTPQRTFASPAEEAAAYFKPWPEPPDRIQVTEANVESVLASVESHAARLGAEMVGSDRAEELASAATVVLRRLCLGVGLEDTIKELEATGLIADTPAARDALRPYFPKGRAMTAFPAVGPSSVYVKWIYRGGIEVPEGFMGARVVPEGPTWPGMNPLGDDPRSGSGDVAEVRFSVWAPLLVGEAPEHHIWGLRFKWHPSDRRWVPMNVIKYVHLERGKPKSVSASTL